MSEQTGVLATSEPGQTTTLTSREYSVLLNALKLWRRKGDKEADAISVAMEEHNASVRREGFSTLQIFFTDLMEALGEHSDDIQGLVVSPYNPPILLLRTKEGERRFKCVAALLTLLERDDWFADFLNTELLYWSDDTAPATPHDIIATLVEKAEAFDCDVTDAKHMLTQYPKLFTNADHVGTVGA